MKPMPELLVASQSLSSTSTGATEGILDGANVGGSVTLILETSAGSITVTYLIGYTDPNLPHIKNNSDLTWITPPDGGAITALTTVTGGTDTAASLELPVAEAYRFVVTENGTGASTVKLIAMTDRSI